MSEINLLPVSIGAKTAATKIATRLKQAAGGVIAVFLILGLTALAYFLIISRELGTIKAHQEELQGTLASLQTSEQQYVLVKDRVGKISQINQEKVVEAGVEKLEVLQTLLPASIVISEADVKKDFTEVTLTATSSKEIVNFFQSLLTSETYEKIVLRSFGFNPSTGFLITLEVL